jgi:hypothetical protein
MSASRDLSHSDMRAYAALAATLAAGDRPREAILRERGLDEAGWEALDRLHQDQLSRAMDEEHDGVPPLVAAYAEAFAAARARSASTQSVLALERFADATREIQRSGDPTAALGRLGIALDDFLRANEHWTLRMMTDPDLLRRFRARLGG